MRDDETKADSPREGTALESWTKGERMREETVRFGERERDEDATF